MTSSLGQLRKRIFGLSPDEATFTRRGFYASDPESRLRLERIGHTFLEGYHLALEDTGADSVASRINSQIDLEFRGFGFEGAAMSLALLDMLSPWTKSRWSALLQGPGRDHVYMIHVGLGWALARMHRRVERPLSRLDPLLGWLALDGYGFHEGYFYPKRYVDAIETPGRLSGDALRVFDQGLGRSLWFSQGADAERIPATIKAFPEARHPDLWSGIGLACAYAGGVDGSSLHALREAVGQHTAHLGQGAAFAAKARQRAGNPALHTQMACDIMCGVSADEAAQWTDAALEGLTMDDNPKSKIQNPKSRSYDLWRQRIRERVDKEALVA
jgi:hypothetical protein